MVAIGHVNVNCAVTVFPTKPTQEPPLLIHGGEGLLDY
jgi:hypothetical protein